MRGYIYVLIFLFIPACASAVTNNSLSGYVKDNDGRPLPGVVIEIPDIKMGAVTDSAGQYKIDNLPKGRFVVVVTLLSYSKATVVVNISGTMKQDFVLVESAIESHEVVITGQSKATEIRRSPIPVSVINSQFLRTNVSTNIIDAITKVPGVSAIATGPNISKPVIRGLGFNRVLTLYNGMRQEGQQWGDEHGVEADQYNIDKVELVKGPSSLIYGSDALAGVVNLIPTKQAPDGKIIGEFLGEYQSNNGLVGGTGMLSGSNKGFYWLGRASGKIAKNYRTPVDGQVYRTNYREIDGAMSFGVNRKWGFSHLDLTLYDNTQSVPDGSRDAATQQFTKQISEVDTVRDIVNKTELNSYSIPAIHQRVQLYRVQLSNSFNVLNGQLIANIGFVRSVRREYSHPEYQHIPGLYLQLNTYTYDIKYHLQRIKGWEVSAGINGMYQLNDVTKGTEFIIPSYTQFDAGPFIVLSRAFNSLNIAGGVRYDNRNFRSDALSVTPDPVTGFDSYVSGNDTAGLAHPFYRSSRSFSGVSYSLGATYVFSKQFSAKANIARGFRAPSITEISADGVHPGTNIYQVGNPNFKPEFSLQEDIGVQFTSEHLSIDVAVFNNEIDNYIFNQRQDSLIGGDIVYKYQQSSAQLYGGEFSIDLHPHPLDWLHFENSVSLVYGINKGKNGVKVSDSEKYLPFIPPIHFVSELRASFKQPIKHFGNSFMKLQLLYYAQQDRVYAADNTETITPSYALINLGLGTDITDNKYRTLFNVSIFANNLMDVAYQDHLNRLKYMGIYNMGRNVGVKLQIPFDLK